jgi:hypothetical protein
VAGLADNNVSPSNENTLLNQQQQGQSEASMQDQPSQIAAAAAAAAAQGSTSSQATAATAAAAASFPGVTAASAAAASSGDLDRQLLDEAWVGDEQGGVYAGGSSSSSGSSAWLPGTGAAAASAGVAGGKGPGSRKGVVVMLLAEGLEILGEKGTKVSAHGICSGFRPVCDSAQASLQLCFGCRTRCVIGQLSSLSLKDQAAIAMNKLSEANQVDSSASAVQLR